MYAIVPRSPTATPLLASVIETPYTTLLPTTLEDIVQVTPPLVVYTIPFRFPTATPLFASAIETPLIIPLVGTVQTVVPTR